MQIKLLAEGGEMKPGPSLSQKLGPVGIPINQVIQKVNDATMEFKGMKVPVEIEINPSTKEFSIKVFSPPVSGLLKKELGLESGSGDQKKIKSANASIEQIISVAKSKQANLLDKTLKSAVKSVLGSCVSLGIPVESKTPQEIQEEVDKGKYDAEISQEKTKTSSEKRKALDEFFFKIKAEQEKMLKLKQEAAVKAAEEKTEEGKTEGKEEPKAKAPEAKTGAKTATKPTAKPAGKK